MDNNDISSFAPQDSKSIRDQAFRPVRHLQMIWIALFATTIFSGAFLLFQVQPILGKFILPWYGGSPGVWTTCMLVFQCLLFGGYAYAHWISSNLSLRQQVVLHAALLLVAFFTLPITPNASWKPIGESEPITSIIGLLLANVGIPYFLLSSTGPLLQSWLTQSEIIDKPYRLYSLSNIGSMLALLSFPFCFETLLSSPSQANLWSYGFFAYGVLCITGAIGIYFRSAILGKTATKGMNATNLNRSETVSQASEERRSNSTSIPLDTRLSWLAFACIPSMMLLATTNQVCLDTAVIPFLWIAPLAIYLLTFILTFDSERWYHRRLSIQLAAISYLFIYLFKVASWMPPLWLEIGLYFSGLFFVCMVCHGELYASRPAPKLLTSFYLSISLGGAIGGLFVGLAAPFLFKGFFEFQLALLCAAVMFIGTYLRKNEVWRNEVSRSWKLGLAVGLPVLATLWITFWNGASGQIARRNFYGVLHVGTGRDLQDEAPMRKLIHGRIVHGSQYLEESRKDLATTYYSTTGGIGRALQSMSDTKLRVGVVGLGAGTLATYGKDGDYYRFYEINPDVLELANEHFTFLKDSRAEIDVVLGDARLVLEREDGQEFDLFVLDAFSGDAIPVHLLTKEAMNVYQKHLKPDGKIALHVSNIYFDLKAIVQGLANEQQYETKFLFGPLKASPDAYASTWALLSRDPQWLEQFDENVSSPSLRKPVLWTDDRSNLFEVLK